MSCSRKLLAPLLCLLGLSAAAQADDAYITALDKELANRAVARQVVPKLAERHAGTAQGDFWQAYAKLEKLQQSRYAAEAKRQGLATQHRSGFKAHASLLLANWFNGAFIRMLAGATGDYLQELRALPVQQDADRQRFWRYVIAQEQVQVEALALAAGKDFKAATTVLQHFTEQHMRGE